jgi:tRNA threonylcarbamoyladenosine biosynthesis protein TsaB
LAVDTATAHCGAALLCADGRFSVQRQRVTTHSESLLRLIQACLGDCGIALRELGGIACSAGPGSFTGLRIGIATAKGLCFALGLPLCTVSSLETLALACAGPAPQRPCLVVLDAFRGQLFARLRPPVPAAPLSAAVQQVFTAEPRLASDAMWQPEALLRAMQPLAGAFHLGGVEPMAGHAKPLEALAASSCFDRGLSLQHPPGADPAEPPPLAMARLAQARLLDGQHAELYTVAPNYLCGSAPEEAERERLLLSPSP